jgi:hypothetical protein
MAVTICHHSPLNASGHNSGVAKYVLICLNVLANGKQKHASLVSITFLEAAGRQKDVGYNSRHITNGKSSPQQPPSSSQMLVSVSLIPI